jgi:peptidoglycan hydrolase-like protein with peptidoglycan-binding domain
MKRLVSVAFAVTLLGGSLLMASEPIRQAQEALKARGFDPGAIDGHEGRQTREAVKAFQQQNGIVPTGRLGGETYDRLGVKRDRPAKQMDAAGAQIKESYSNAGRNIGQGGKDMGADLKHGQVTDAAKDFGVGLGRGAKKFGIGTGKATKHAAKGVADAFVPHNKK